MNLAERTTVLRNGFAVREIRHREASGELLHFLGG
jgi:hypothetical protein